MCTDVSAISGAYIIQIIMARADVINFIVYFVLFHGSKIWKCVTVVNIRNKKTVF